MLFKIVFLALFATTALIGEEVAQTPPVAVNIDQVSETLGHLLVRQLENPVISFNMEKIIEGMKNARAGKSAPLSEAQYEEQVLLIQEQIYQKTAETNLSEANTFLEKNASVTGIVSLNPKLQYKIEAEGTGEGVTADATPLIHYTGKLLNGNVFASSKESGKPIPLSLQETIEGFNKGIVGMKQGEKRTLYVHPELAYGLVSHLPPNSLLIFEVELIETAAKEEPVAQIDGNHPLPS